MGLACAVVRPEEPFAAPVAQYPEDAGLDLTVSRYTVVSPGQDVNLSTNIAVATPKGYFGLILPRSSTLTAKGLHISPGVIDSGYRGEVMITARNVSTREVQVSVGERVAQMLILPRWEGKVEVVPSLIGGSRGTAGLGSTRGYRD